MGSELAAIYLMLQRLKWPIKEDLPWSHPPVLTCEQAIVYSGSPCRQTGWRDGSGHVGWEAMEVVPGEEGTFDHSFRHSTNIHGDGISVTSVL